jgi:DNA-binding NtrC family response regulator
MILNESSTSSNGSILIADDDMLYRRILSEYLIRERFQVTAVQSSEEVIRSLMHATFDLCVLDFFLPGISFDEVVTTISHSMHYTPFIVITGDETCETERRARSYGPIFYFIKPFSLRDFGSVVREVVGRAGITVSTRITGSEQ